MCLLRFLRPCAPRPAPQHGEGYHFPLFHAADGMCDATRGAIVAMLVAAKAKVDSTTPGGCSALWKAANEGFGDVVLKLIELKAGVNQVGWVRGVGLREWRVRSCGRSLKSPSLTHSLTHSLTNTQSLSHSRTHALFLTYTLTLLPWFRLLLLPRPPPVPPLPLPPPPVPRFPSSLHSLQVQKSTSISPLYNACFRGHHDVVGMLLDAKADPRFQRHQTGATALYTSAENGHARATELLLRAQCSPDEVTTKTHSSPLYVALASRARAYCVCVCVWVGGWFGGWVFQCLLFAGHQAGQW
jgi:hypothetical protein